MYNIKIENYVPKPNPAKSKYNVMAHYYAAWKKGAAGLHEGFDDLHDYPERTPLAGYYDEENPMYSDWEIKWALEHGINCFIHCWYRKKDNEHKPVTVKDLRCAHALHEAFFNAKYQNMMNFAIMYEVSERWGGTDADDMLEHLMPFWIENYFKRENYLKVDNKPVLFVYDGNKQLRNAFENAQMQRKTFDKCRELAKKHGFDGMIFALEERGKSEEKAVDTFECGYDFAFAYHYGYSGVKGDFPESEYIINDQVEYFEKEYAKHNNRYVPTASCFWDPQPRRTQKWIDNGYLFFSQCKKWHISADDYRTVLKNCVKMTKKAPENAPYRNFIMIDNWNEWDEGHYVAPNHQYGFTYLQAIREELTERNNLPDYRTPQDIGLSNFNKSWGTPDLSGIYNEKFNK